MKKMKKTDEVCHKSRYGRVSNKRKFNEELNTSLRETYKKIQDCILPGRSNEKAINNNNTSMTDRKSNTYNVGDIVWAKTGKYPVWPGIVITDPESNTFSKSENMVPMLHIYYCNDAYRRNWIKYKQISKFSGKNEILNEIPKITTQISRSKLKVKWNQAVDEAECLAAMKIDKRISSFFDNKFPAATLPLNNKAGSSTDHASTNRQRTKLENNHNDNQNVVSNHEEQILVFQANTSKEDPRTIIPELCKQFYTNGWVTGTGGGISIRFNDKIFIAPSGVQKERINPEDLFVQDINGIDIEVPPAAKKLTKSQCTPIFMCSYIERNAGAVIHIHSTNVVKLCLLNPENNVKITGLEMIKGIYNEQTGKCYDNDEELIIPIIENSKYEKDLVDTFKIALKKYPSTSAVLVRNHGMYVWGRDWVSAKTQLECYEYLFKIIIFKKINNV